MTSSDFQQVLDFIARETGIALPESNYRHVQHYLAQRLSALKVTLPDYLVSLRNQRAEYDRFLDVITIGETYFFREEKHFKVLESLVFPSYHHRLPTLRIWSAACSTGEEAVSLAALAEKWRGNSGLNNYQVLATDVNPHALQILTAGTFKANSFREDGAGFHPLLHPFLQQRGNHWHLTEGLQKRLQILPFNLFQDDVTRLSSGFQIVFLRNMLVYVPLETRLVILNKVVDAMAEEGYLFLASTETPLLSHPHLKLSEYQGVYFFQKKTLQEKQQGLIFESQLLAELQAVPAAASQVHAVQSAAVRPACNDPEEILFFANQKLNNRLFTLENNLNYTLALHFLQVVYAINAHQLNEARNVLAEALALAAPNEISFYLTGYLEMVAQHGQKAIQQFQLTLEQNASFWPARFYLGILLHPDQPQRARTEFARCHKSIAAYLQRNQYQYQFLLEGFNAKYFLSMCQRWEEKLSEQG